jgi:hypothetical protein
MANNFADFASGGGDQHMVETAFAHVPFPLSQRR